MVFRRIFKKRLSSLRRRSSNSKKASINRSCNGSKRGSSRYLDRYEAKPIDFPRQAVVETVMTNTDDKEYGYYYDNSDSEMVSNDSDKYTTTSDYSPATVYMFPEEWKERTGSRCDEMRNHRGNDNNNEEMLYGSMMIVEDEDRYDNDIGSGGGWDTTISVDEDRYISSNINDKNEQSSSLWLSCLSCV